MKPELNPIYFYSIDHKLGKSDLRRLSIINSAIKSIADEGIEGANFERLARKLKLRRSHIVYYFKDRDSLVIVVIRYVVALAQEMTSTYLLKKSTPSDKILGIAEATFKWADDYKDHIRVLVAFYSLSAGVKTFRKLNTEFREIGTARVVELLKQMNSKGSSKLLTEQGRSIQCIISGHVIEYISSDSDVKFKQMCINSIKSVLGLNHR